MFGLLTRHEVSYYLVIVASYYDTSFYTALTMKELLTYLQGVNDWETFGYLLLPADKAHLIEIFSLSYIHSYIVTFISILSCLQS